MGLLSLPQTQCAPTSTWAHPRVTLRALGWVGKMEANMKLAQPVPGIKSFVSDPGISYLLPAPMTLWQVTLLAGKWGKILDVTVLDKEDGRKGKKSQKNEIQVC